MRRSAVIYSVNDRLVVAASSRTTAGVGLQHSPSSAALDAEPHELSTLIESVLGHSEEILPHPKQSEWKGSFDPILKASGVRSQKAFMASARCVSIDQKDTAIIVTPHRNLGAREGFEELGAEARMASNLTNATDIALDFLR